MAFHALKNEIIALLIVFILGMVCGAVFLPFRDSLQWPTAEMRLRGEPSGLGIGVLVALPSGAGVTLAITSGGVNSLVGVAISASLLPPAVNAGMCLIFGIFGPLLYHDLVPSELFAQMGISISLTLINILCINVMAMIFFKIKAVAPIASSIPYNKLDREGYVETKELYHMKGSNPPVIPLAV